MRLLNLKFRLSQYHSESTSIITSGLCVVYDTKNMGHNNTASNFPYELIRRYPNMSELNSTICLCLVFFIFLFPLASGKHKKTWVKCF